MIPEMFIEQWRKYVQWQTRAMIEQDLVISRALVCLYNHPEINTTEHFQVLAPRLEPFSMKSQWFSGTCEIVTYQLEELIATKLRALYQRRKGRDLFDVWYVLNHSHVDIDQIIAIFQQYCAYEGIIISKELFHKNLLMKKLHKDFQVDMYALLPHQMQYNFDEAFAFVLNHIISRLK